MDRKGWVEKKICYQVVARSILATVGGGNQNVSEPLFFRSFLNDFRFFIFINSVNFDAYQQILMSQPKFVFSLFLHSLPCCPKKNIFQILF